MRIKNYTNVPCMFRGLKFCTCNLHTVQIWGRTVFGMKDQISGVSQTHLQLEFGVLEVASVRCAESVINLRIIGVLVERDPVGAHDVS